MATAIDAACGALLERDIIDSQSYGSIGHAIGQVRANGMESKAWRYSISASSPLTFSQVIDVDLNEIITPRIYLTVDVDDSLAARNVPPFSDLNCVLEILGEDSRIIMSTHIDLAEKNNAGIFQGAPLYHLQFGGHRPGGDRTQENRLKVPRLMHPPLDLLLALDILVANFFPDKWEELRQDPSWIAAICQSQKLCYTTYVSKLADCLNEANATVLEQLWAPVWGV